MFADAHLPSQKTFVEMEQAEAALEQALRAVQSVKATVTNIQLDDVPDEILAGYARLLVRERKNRYHFFPDYSFGEPVWDILLDLYIARCSGKLISISSACIAAGVPPTTGLRYVTMMTNEGLIERSADRSDSRVFHVTLSDEMHQAMRDYLIRTSQECRLAI
jgi:DNA-binding MarR family transcriptional regulator